MPFQKGQSGNPAGRKRGSRCKSTVEFERMLDDISARLGTEDYPKTDAHTLLVAMYNHPRVPLPLKLEALKVAIAYEKPRLTASSVSGEIKHRVGIAEQLTRAKSRMLTIDGRLAPPISVDVLEAAE